MPKGSLVFVCKASINDGLGHFIRSKTLADYISKELDLSIAFYFISNIEWSHQLDTPNYSIVRLLNEKELKVQSEAVYVLDALKFEESFLIDLKKAGSKIISISPISNALDFADSLITRTKYINPTPPDTLRVFGGMEYSIIRADCHRISTEAFQRNLKEHTLNIAISMGGTDPENLTLECLKKLKGIPGSVLFWVIIGEGFEHNYRELSDSIATNANHEIILARTNKNMWRIMANCNLAILKGGLTSYEAAFAGLPAINIINQEDRFHLVQELKEEHLCVDICKSVDESIEKMNEVLQKKKVLERIHQKSKEYFVNSPLSKVSKIIEKHVYG